MPGIHLRSKLRCATRGWTLPVITTLAAILVTGVSSATPVFMADEEAMPDQGELWVDAWAEPVVYEGGGIVLGMLQVGFGVSDKLSVGFGAGAGMDNESSFTSPSPYFQAQVRLFDPEGSTVPGITLAAGFAPALGFGEAALDEHVAYLILPLSFSLFEDLVQAHLNVGVKGEVYPSFQARFFWGLGADVALIPDLIYASALVFAGDVLAPIDTDLGAQLGLFGPIGRSLEMFLLAGTIIAADDTSGITSFADYSYEWYASLGLSWAYEF